MKCYNCGSPLDRTDICPECGTDVRIWKKIQFISNRLYNEGLAKAQARDLSGAAESLLLSLRYNKMNMQARNLLGLVYFELGETVNAVSEWVISKSLNSADNPASGYLSKIQNNSARLELLNQTIKKYNQALAYCKQRDYDLAIIQMKKVLSLNPKLVKGYQLLALLYIRDRRYAQAKKLLQKAERIDGGNADTRHYLRECAEYLRNPEKNKEKATSNAISYHRDNEWIIKPNRFSDNSLAMTLLNLLIGVAIGVAVVAFLVIPSVKQNANSIAKKQLVKANETISTREQSIQSLEDQISELNTKLKEEKVASSASDDKVTSYEKLLVAYAAYADKDYTTAGENLLKVDKSLLSKKAKTIYNDMYDTVNQELLGTMYREAVSTYGSKDYKSAITQFKKIYEMDKTYQNGKIAYYIAYSYMNQDDSKNAIKWFNIVVDTTTSSSLKSSSESCIKSLESQN